MGTSLSGLTPATTFDGLLKVGDNDPLTATLKPISTGDGTDTILSLSNSTLQISGATTIVSDNTGNDIPFEVNTSSTGLLQIRNLNTATTPILGISHGSQDTRLSMYTTMGFRVQGINIANMTSSEVGVGGGSGARLAVKGSGATSATTSLLVQNSGGTQTFAVRDDGRVLLGTAGDAMYVDGYTLQTYTINNTYLNSSKIGIGVNASTTIPLQIKSTGNDATTTALLVQNSDASDLLKVTDDGGVSINGRLSMVGNGFQSLFNNTWGINHNGNNISFAAYDKHTFQNWTSTGLKTTLLINGSGTNGEVGINNATPAAQLDIKGSGATSATSALLVQNSAGTQLFKIFDDGNIRIGDSIANKETHFRKFRITDASIFPLSSGNLGENDNTARHYGNIYSLGVTHITDNTTSSTTLDASAKLQVDSTTQGFLPPRMTTAQRDAITTPAAGLMIYNTDTNTAECWNGSAWMPMF